MNMNLKRPELEQIVDYLPVGIMVFDREMRLRLWNEVALSLTGIGIEDVLSGDYAELLNDEMRLKFDAATGNSDTSHEHWVIERDGKSIGYTLRSIRNDGEDNTILIIEDATKFMDVEKIKRDFIGTLLHKLRGPLSTLKTSLSMLQAGAVKGISTEAHEILDMGYHEVNRLVRLVGNMRDLFMIETGLAEKDMDIEEFPLSLPLNRAIEELAKMDPPFAAVRKRLVLKGHFNIGVRKDFEKLKKVFLILFKNALMYSQEETEVTVTCEENGDYIDVRIEDTGIGMSEESLPLLFGKYFRENNEATKVQEGNGLGLYIAKSFIELMKGTIYCESIQGKGSAFFFSLPRKDGAISHG